MYPWKGGIPPSGDGAPSSIWFSVPGRFGELATAIIPLRPV